jgi:hypothetical protein
MSCVKRGGDAAGWWGLVTKRVLCGWSVAAALAIFLAAAAAVVALLVAVLVRRMPWGGLSVRCWQVTAGGSGGTTGGAGDGTATLGRGAAETGEGDGWVARIGIGGGACWAGVTLGSDAKRTLGSEVRPAVGRNLRELPVFWSATASASVVRWYVGTLVRWYVGTLVRWYVGDGGEKAGELFNCCNVAVAR